MISLKTARQYAISFDEVEEQPHFEKPSFRVHKKIFLTLDEKNKRACLKLSEMEQSIFSTIDKNIIFPVPNKWGKQGWTFVELEHIERKLFKAILTSAYCHVAPKKLADKFRE